MKTLRLLGLLLIAGVLFSCEKDIEKDNVKQDVVFGIDHVAPFVLKEAVDGDPEEWDWKCDGDLVPAKAHIEIAGIPTPFTPDVFFVNGKLYTQSIKLDPTTEGSPYVVTKFVLLDEYGEIIMATPEAGSEYAEYVTKPISFEFHVNPFEKAEEYVEVLCFEESDYDAFGFTWFQIGRIVVREMCFFGDFCIKDAAEYAESLYANQNGFPAEGYVDAAAIFEIHVSSDNGFEKVYSNAEWYGVGKPLCVQYPDNLNVTETFTFKLKILVKVGDDYEYVHFQTWTVVDDEKIPTDDYGVVDFVLGSCAYMPAEETLILPPYQNLPDKARVSIFAEVGDVYANGSYWDLSVEMLSPTGSFDFPPAGDGKTYLGWCGDATTGIASGQYEFFIYSSLNNVYRPWPSGMPVTLGDLAKVNWLFNNLGTFGFPSLTDMFVHTGNFDVDEVQGKDLQHAIWMLLGVYPGDAGWPVESQGGGTVSAEAWDMYNTASGKSDFVPHPGGYAAVLMVADDNGEPNVEDYQLVFTVVDP